MGQFNLGKILTEWIIISDHSRLSTKHIIPVTNFWMDSIINNLWFGELTSELPTYDYGFCGLLKQLLIYCN